MIRAGGWVMFGHLSGLAVRLASNLITTRLLAPEMFGVITIAMTVTTIVALLSDIGLRESLIQNKHGDDPVFQNTAWTVQIVRGFVTWAGALVAAGALYLAATGGLVGADSTYATPHLPLILAATSFVAVINGFRSTKMYTSNRHFDLKKPIQIELLVQIATSLATIALAYYTRSVWAMVIGMLAGSALTVVLSQYYMPGPPNALCWDKRALRELMEFGKWVILSSAINVFAMNGDKLLLAGFVGADVLGLYSIAFLLASVIDGMVQKLVSIVSFPALSEIFRTAPAKLPSVLTRLRTWSDSGQLFMAGLLFAVAPAVIDLLYDDRYAAAGPMLQMLSFILVGSRYAMLNQVYLAMGKTKYQAVINVVSVAALFVAVPLGYQWFGILGAIAAIALRSLAAVPLMFYFNAKHGLNDFKLEALVLLVWPVGFAAGWLVLRLLP
jgi:O-antigen/teichoic acid export membrane protein